MFASSVLFMSMLRKRSSGRCGKKGVFYVKSNYNWTLIMGRLKQAIKSI